jgi:putative chitinase
MIQLTLEQFAAATGARVDRAQERLAVYLEMMAAYGIDTRLRIACFLPQVGHESGGFKHREEIWGPTAQQLRYERDFLQPWPGSLQEARAPACARNSLAWRLGNANKGDGRRYAGHGDMQITGRTNHALARDRMRARFAHLQVPDFEAEPQLLADLPWAAFAAGDFWERNDLNAYADVGNFDGVADLVNRGRVTVEPGDSNGFEHRLDLFERAMIALPAKVTA